VTIAITTPWYSRTAELASGKWRKRLLPLGEINYKGRVLKFDRPYLAGLVEAFRSRAYDQVPFQLADAANAHTNDPERTRGQITDMTLEADGLWITLDPTSAGDDVIRGNPGLGVSARIVEDYDRADGKFFPRAIQHVLGTLDPRITGMGGWEAVAAAGEAEFTYDLSNESWKETGMPDLTDEQNAKLAKLLDLDPEKLAAVVATLDPGAVGSLNGDGDEGSDPELDAIAAQIDGMTDEELEAWATELEGEESETEPEPVTAGAGLSGEAQMALELAQATGDTALQQLGVIQAQLDRERWTGEKARLVAGGTPPYIADLAQPLLEGAGHVVDLAGGKSADAGQIVRKILAEYQKLGQQLGLGVELGTGADEPEGASAAQEARDDVISRARRQMFGMA
jgi:hypothetical protein